MVADVDQRIHLIRVDLLQPVSQAGRLGLGGALRQLAHFVRHHGKASPLLPRPCRLDRGVEGNQVRLLGNLADDIHGAAYRSGTIAQSLDLLRALFDTA